jgi:hypothetical protein
MNWSYLFKHWCGTLLIGPFIAYFIFYYSSNTSRVFGLVEIFPLTLLFSIVFSIPTYIIYGSALYFLESKKFNKKIIKIVINLIAVTGIILTFHNLFNVREPLISVAYIIASVIAGSLFKLKNDNN